MAIDWQAKFFEQILHGFTSHKIGFRHESTAPWTIGDYIYATNGYAAIRVDLREIAVQIPDVPLLKGKTRPKVAELFEMWDFSGDGYVSLESLQVRTSIVLDDKDGSLRYEPGHIDLPKNGQPLTPARIEYLLLFNDIPGCEYRCGATGNDVVLFRFAGGQGLLSPMIRKDQEKGE